MRYLPENQVEEEWNPFDEKQGQNDPHGPGKQHQERQIKYKLASSQLYSFNSCHTIVLKLSCTVLDLSKQEICLR